jgi:hypothetical protein
MSRAKRFQAKSVFGVAEQKRDLSPVRNFPDAHRGLEVPEDVVVRCQDCHARHHRTLWVSNSSSGGKRQLDEIHAMRDPTHVA